MIKVNFKEIPWHQPIELMDLIEDLKKDKLLKHTLKGKSFNVVYNGKMLTDEETKYLLVKDEDELTIYPPVFGG